MDQARHELHFLSGLFDAAGNEAALTEPLLAFNRLVRGCNASIAIIDPRRPSTSLYVPSHIPGEMVVAYLPQIGDDPWYAAASRLVGLVHVLGTQLVPQREYRRSRVYTDMNRRVGSEYSALSILRGSDLDVGLVANRSARQGDFDTSVLKRMRVWFPHVVRFARLHLALTHDDAVSPDRCIVEEDDNGIFFVSAAARTLLLDAAAGISCGADGLHITGDQDASFRSACRACLNGSAPAQSSFSVIGGGSTLTISVRPRREITPSLTRRWLARIELQRSSVAVKDGSAIARTYRLTAAERRLLLAVQSGVTLREYAQQVSRSIHTVQTQMKMLLQKTGSRRQLDLLRLS